MLPRQHPLLLLALLAIPMPVVAERPPIDFSRDVLPILSENCFFCHGPDANHREADLRLDTATGAATVVDHAKPDASELLLRIRSTDPDLQMPPPGSNRQLTPQQVQTLQQWIAGGADWGVHWSFRPIVGPPVPELASRSDIAPVRNAIDAFIQQQLVVEGLLPSPEADRRTLIRRVTLDLTGLPPTPSEVEAFLADESPDAYEKLVDRLLASPAYGERMAWDWLDAARYADTNGYQGDRERTMWPWRDWVIKAFNENLPYDDFTVWQLAGAGAVGAQSLTGLPVLERLRRAFPKTLAVWPFQPADTPVVVAEVYPSMLSAEVRAAEAAEGAGACRDRVQVTLLASALLRLSQAGTLGEMLHDRRAGEDGQILGAGHVATLRAALAD